MLKVFDIKKSLPSIFMISLIFAGAAVYFLLFANIKKELWTPGPISKSHSFIEKDCKSCHMKGFTEVEDRSCLKCHNLSRHSKEHEKEFKSNCVSCHSEHSGEQKLSHKSDAVCLSCHNNLSQKYKKVELKNVNSFVRHPEFQIKEKDSSTISLNHMTHLQADLDGPNGPTQLNCNSCHQLDKLGRRMKPIRFENHCSTCHSLEFDERLPGRVVPHGKTDEVYNFLFREYTSLYLKEEQVSPEKRLIRPGVETEELRTPEYALKRVQEVTREIERDLITKRGCVLCHDVVERKQVKEKKSAFKVKNPNVPVVWMKKAVFKHGSHEFATCETCHGEVKNSELTSDVLLPKLKDCNSCHGLHKAPSDCLTCHSYHDSLAIKINKKQPADRFHD